MSIDRAWVGACTDDGFVVSVLVDGPSDVRLAVDTDDGFGDPVFTTLLEGVNGWTKLPVAGLDPDTVYHWAVEEDTELVVEPRGAIRTFPEAGEPASFTFAAASCADNGSNAVSFERILARQPLFFMHMGDMHYANIATNNQTAFRTAIAGVLNQSNQAALYQNVPIAYMWDDHDYGDNNADGSSASRSAALTVYREAVPHYPIPFDGAANDTPISQTFVVGRVRFVTLDIRSESDLSGDAGEGVIIGPVQLAWLLDLIATFTERLLVIDVSVPWIVTGGDVESGADDWGNGAAEREAIADAIQSHARGRVLIIHGDMHGVAFDTGVNSNFAADPIGLGPPVFGMAPLDQDNSVKGGPYNLGTYTQSRFQYGVVSVADNGGDITVTGRGFRADTDSQLVAHQFTIPQTAPVGVAATPVSGSRIDLEWDAYPGATGYDVERDGVVVAYDVADTSYSDTGLEPSTEYVHRVRAVF